VKSKTSSKQFLRRPIILVSLLLFFIRSFPILQKPSLWAEDANVFFSPLLGFSTPGPAHEFALYANQHWLFIHLLAGGIYRVAQLNLLNLPFISSLVSIIIILVVASAWLKSNLLITNKRNRELIFGFILLAPSSWESFGNLANTYVYFFVAIVAISGWEFPKKRRYFILENTFLFLLAFTSISAIFIVIALTFRIILNQRTRLSYLPLLYLIIVIVQFENWTRRGPSDNSLNLNQTVENIFYILVKRVFAEVIVGQNGGNYLSNVRQWNGWSTWFFIAIVPMALVLFLFSKVFKHFDLLLIIKMGAVAIPALVHLLLYIFASLELGLNQLFLFGSGGRYLLFTHILVFILLIIVAERLAKILPVKKFSKIFGIFIIIWSSGISADFVLNSKTNQVFQDDWKTFSECMEMKKIDCFVSVPPGGLWGFNK
jgi:hypothetical protein